MTKAPPLPRETVPARDILFLHPRGAAYVLPVTAASLYVVPAWAAVHLAGADLPPGWCAVRACWRCGWSRSRACICWAGSDTRGFTCPCCGTSTRAAIVAVIASSMVFLFAQVGVALTHWVHHRYTNRVEDPDLRLFGAYQTLPRRLLFGRMAANRSFMVNLLRIAFDRRLPVSNVGPFRRSHLRALAWLNIAATLGLGGRLRLAGRALADGGPGGRGHAAHLSVSCCPECALTSSTRAPASAPSGTRGAIPRRLMTALFVGNNFHLDAPPLSGRPVPSPARGSPPPRRGGVHGRLVEPTFRGALAHARAVALPDAATSGADVMRESAHSARPGRHREGALGGSHPGAPRVRERDDVSRAGSPHRAAPGADAALVRHEPEILEALAVEPGLTAVRGLRGRDRRLAGRVSTTLAARWTGG